MAEMPHSPATAWNASAAAEEQGHADVKEDAEQQQQDNIQCFAKATSMLSSN